MKLADLRKIAVKNKLRVRFMLSNGMACVVDEHGVAKVPALQATATFNLEDELVPVQNFQVEPAGAPAKEKPRVRSYTRDELAALAGAASRETAHEEHEE